MRPLRPFPPRWARFGKRAGVSLASAFLALLLAELAAPALSGDRFALRRFESLSWPNMDLWRPSRDLPYELIPNLDASMGPGKFTNSLGMRDKEHAAPGPGDSRRLRIAVLSDSIGMYGRWPDMLGEILQREHPGRYDIWNWSVGGFGLAEYERILERRALRYRPGLILIGFELFDLTPTPVILKTAGGRLLCYRPFNLAGGLYLDTFLYAHSYLYRIAMSVLEKREGLDPSNPRDMIRYGRPALKRITRLAAERHIPVVAAVFPRLKAPAAYTALERGAHAAIRKLLLDGKIPFLDLSGLFPARGREHYRWTPSDEIHFNDRGSLVIAEALAKFLTRTVSGKAHQSGKNRP